MLFSLNRCRKHALALNYALWLAASVFAAEPSTAQTIGGGVTMGPYPDPILIQQEATDETNFLYPVKGIVLNSVTHQPVARALVDSHEGAVLTDNDGNFELSLPQGMVQISVRRPGYGTRGRSSNHSVRVGPNMPSLTFSLTPEALITGQVTLSTSDPADGIRVMAYRRRVINGRSQWVMENTARTTSDGTFRIAGLQPGDYLIYTQPARDSDGPLARGAAVYGYPASYYPGVADISSAGVLTLAAGQRAEADFILARQRFYHVTVTVPDRENGGGLNLQVHDRNGRQMGAPVRWDDQQGMAEVNLPNGIYFIEGRKRGESQLYGRVDFTVAGAPVTGLTMSLTPLHAIPVTVRKIFTASSNGGQGGGLVTSDGISDNQASPGLNLSLISVDEFFGSMGAMGGGLRPADGANDGSSFEMENVTPGRYWVEASPFEGYVSSISSGGVDLAREPLVIGAGGSSPPIEVTLRDDAGTISVELAGDSAGAVPATTAVGEQKQIYVYAIPLFESAGSIRMSGLQGPGQVAISGLAPGSYRVIAFDAPQEIDFHTPEGLAKYTGMGETTTVEANGTSNVQLEVIHTFNPDAE